MSKRKSEVNTETKEVADNADPPAKKGRGRPRIHPPTVKDPDAPTRPRGRPKKAGGGDKAAAKPKKQGKGGKRGRPAGSTNKKGRGKKAAKEPEAEAPEEEEEEEAAEDEEST